MLTQEQINIILDRVRYFSFTFEPHRDGNLKNAIMDEIYNDPNCVVSILSCKKISPKNESHKNLFKVNDNGYNDLWKESRSFHITYRPYNEEKDKVNICVKSYSCAIPMNLYDLNWECNFTFNKTFMANTIFDKHLKIAFDNQLENEYEDMLEKQKMNWIKNMREEVIPEIIS